MSSTVNHFCILLDNKKYRITPWAHFGTKCLDHGACVRQAVSVGEGWLILSIMPSMCNPLLSRSPPIFTTKLLLFHYRIATDFSFLMIAYWT